MLEQPEEITEAVYFNLSQLEALIIGLPEMIAGATHRLKMFSGPDARETMRSMVKKQEPGIEVTDRWLDARVEENKALATSLLAEYPGIIQEVKEAYQMLTTTVEQKKKIIIDPEWPPKNLKL